MITPGSIPILDGWQAHARLVRTGEDDLAEGNTKSTLIVVALIAFFVGRCSATPDSTLVLSTSAAAPGNATPAAAQPLLSQAEPASTPTARTEAADTTANLWTSGSAAAAAEWSVDDPEPVAEPEPHSEPAADVYYQNCAAVRAAGAAPLNEGEPGYAPKLDRDRDGVACE